MTDQQLRDLLEERVADVTAPDLTAGAWRTGRRTRRRERLAAAGAAVVVTAAIGTGIALVGGTDDSGPEPTPSGPKPSPTQTVGREPDATYEDVPVWWSPEQQDERDLAFVDSPLPEEINLDEGPWAKAIPYAVAAFSGDRGNRLVLLGPTGGMVSVSLDRLEDVTKPNGYSYRPVGTSMLSPTGDYVVFPQDDSVRIYTVGTGAWSTIDTGDARTLDVAWAGDDTLVLPRNGSGGAGPAWRVDGTSAGEAERPRANPGFDTKNVQAYGQTFVSGSSSAQTWGMGLGIPVRDPGHDFSNPDFIAATAGGTTSLLAMMWNADDGVGSRFKDCCPVAGWLSDDVLVYESKQSEPALVAWTVGTDQFRLVSRIEGDYFVASFADLSRP